MAIITIHCRECKGLFTISHPSLTSLERARGITLNCKHCGLLLHVKEIKDKVLHMYRKPHLTLVPEPEGK